MALSLAVERGASLTDAHCKLIYRFLKNQYQQQPVQGSQAYDQTASLHVLFYLI